MKKSLMFAGTVMAAILMTGCAGVADRAGSPSAASLSPNFYSDYKANAYMTPVCAADCKVLQRNVTATAVTNSYFGCITLGDASYATLKAAILAQVPGADDITDVQIDFSMKNILGINEVTTVMTATAVAHK